MLIFWEMTFGFFRLQHSLVQQWIHIYVSLWRLVGFHALRDGSASVYEAFLMSLVCRSCRFPSRCTLWRRGTSP